MHHINNGKAKNLDHFYFAYLLLQIKPPKTQWLIVIIYLFAHDSAIWAYFSGDSLFLLCVTSVGTRISKMASSVTCLLIWDGWGLAKHLPLFIWTLQVVSLGFHIIGQIQSSRTSYTWWLASPKCKSGSFLAF